MSNCLGINALLDSTGTSGNVNSGLTGILYENPGVSGAAQTTIMQNIDCIGVSGSYGVARHDMTTGAWIQVPSVVASTTFQRKSGSFTDAVSLPACNSNIASIVYSNYQSLSDTYDVDITWSYPFVDTYYIVYLTGLKIGHAVTGFNAYIQSKTTSGIKLRAVNAGFVSDSGGVYNEANGVIQVLVFKI